MKMYLSAFLPLLLLLALVGCSKEQFGSVPQSEKSTIGGLQSFEQLSCSTFTLIKPKVDILYVVDNSTSTYYLASDIKAAISNTVSSISKEFDYRVVGTPLIETASGNSDYQVMTNSQDSMQPQVSSHKIISSSEFNFFQNTANGGERGLARIQSFISAHTGDGLFRQQAYLLVVLISNGRDTDVERALGTNGETGLVCTNGTVSSSCSTSSSVYSSRKSSILSLKGTLNSQQFRLFSVVAPTNCQSGWLSSQKSYIQMSKDLYLSSGATDQGSNLYPDHYNLCTGGISSIFTAVNNSIKQVVIPHEYRYAPITFADVSTNNVSVADTLVYKVTGNSTPVLMPSSEWTIDDKGANVSVPLREVPSLGEYVTGRYFVKFNNRVVYPDCVLVKSKSRTEYFDYIVLPKEPLPAGIAVRINGQVLPTTAWSYIGYKMDQNIKAAFPQAGDELPVVSKSGYMIQILDSSNYYKSGDSVEVSYLPAGI